MSTITERRDMCLHAVPFSMSLLDFGMCTMLANFHVCGIMFLRILLNMQVQEGLCDLVPDI